MDFILGILTTLSLIITWGYFLNRKEKKVRHTTVKEGVGIYINGKLIAALKTTELDAAAKVTEKGHSFAFEGLFKPDIPELERMLNAALEREDYLEAARIRDLMNKQ